MLNFSGPAEAPEHAGCMWSGARRRIGRSIELATTPLAVRNESTNLKASLRSGSVGWTGNRVPTVADQPGTKHGAGYCS